ncbi:MAG: serine/threonine protein kinase, partial [Zavarzinella sp.]|nr:serine/threonine protein kinase [Zavarzinella sp.]
MPSDAPPSPSSTEVNALADRLAQDMRRRWNAGDRVATEDFVAAHPALRDHPGAIGELIYEEVSLRREHGEPGGSSEVLRRFPQWATQLRVMLELRDALEADGPPAFPEPGERLGEFRLLAELGRGSRGRVYLARQPALADRPVVVKVSSRADAEHLSLARLQHTHIVPLYAAQDDPARGLRVLCMPYFGGTTLAHVLAKLAPIPPADRTVAGVWAAILAEPPSAIPVTAPPMPSRWSAMDYTGLIAHFGACLADALQFAHDRGLIHMDVKPSNILLTADGQPMLLDFHLARPLVRGGEPAPARLGGTAAYGAPEQRAALVAVRSGQRISVAVDCRADAHALGVVLYEALAGRFPSPGVPAFRYNPRVSVGLSDIVARCLAPDPAARYPDAAALADDLRRHLAALPLRGVRNRSLA